MFDILKYAHDEPCCGHFANKRIAYKILRIGYFLPSLFKDAKQYVRRCDSFYWMGQPVQANEMHLCPQVMIEPFEKWAIDFVGPINPTSLNKKHILDCTDFGTKWVEANAVSFATDKVVVDFLFIEIFTRFGVPR